MDLNMLYMVKYKEVFIYIYLKTEFLYIALFSA